MLQIFRMRYELVNGVHDVLIPAFSELAAINIVRSYLQLPDNEDRNIRTVEILGRLGNAVNPVYAMPSL